MTDLREKQRKSMPKAVFAYVDPSGEGHLPLNDESHIRNAMAKLQARTRAQLVAKALQEQLL